MKLFMIKSKHSGGWATGIRSGLLTLLIAAAFFGLPAWAQDQLRVNVIDVGQSEAILLELPDYDTVLIDGGDWYNRKALLKYLESRNVREISYLISTHPHDDHIGGLSEVVENYPIGMVYYCDVAVPSPTNLSLMEKLKSKEIPMVSPKAGTVIIDKPGLKLEVVSPDDRPHELLNNSSIVLKLTYGNKKFLFTGDAEFEAERDMLARGADLRADVLKMGHHGSPYSSGNAFLDAVRPSIGLVSVGPNKYGLPGDASLGRMAEHGASVYRTDELGTLIVTCDGEHIEVDHQRTWKPKPPSVLPTLDSEEAKGKKGPKPPTENGTRASKKPRIR